MVGNPVAKSLDQFHARAEILADQRSVQRKCQAKPMSPELFIGSSEQTGPKGEGETGDRSSPCDRLAVLQPLDCCDHPLDSIRPQRVEVKQPRICDRGFGLGMAENSVDGISHQDLEVVDQLEGCRTELGVPFIEGNRRRMVPVAAG